MAFRVFVIALIAILAVAGGADHAVPQQGLAADASPSTSGLWLAAIFIAFGAAQAIKTQPGRTRRP